MEKFYNFLFIVLPYLSLTVFLIGTIYRYTQIKFKFSSLSSQFLEGKNLFWGSIPFHWGLVFLFCGHLIAFLIPGTVIAWNREPLRLLILELSAFAFGLSVLVGIVALLYRRFTNDRIRIVTSKMDVVIELLIFIQVILGLWIAIVYAWGSTWFSAVLTPYLWSLFGMDPAISAVTSMPLIVQLHISIAFIILFLIPFTRLVHVLVLPLHYIWRPYQRVLWYWDKNTIRDSNTPWNITKPQNN